MFRKIFSKNKVEEVNKVERLTPEREINKVDVKTPEKEENKIETLISAYNMKFTIELLEGRGFSKPKYIEILDGILIYMEKQEMGVTACEAFYCKNGKCESHRGLYNLGFLTEFIYKRERLTNIKINGQKINTSHVELDEVYPNQTGDFNGLLNQYGIKEEVLGLVDNKGVDPEFSWSKLQLPGNKYLISSTKLNNRNYSYAYLCYGTDIVRFDGIFSAGTLMSKIFEIFMGDIEVKELN